MADGLFLMQRYLGSDDEDSEESNHPAAETKVLIEEDVQVEGPEHKKKKRKPTNEQLLEEDQTKIAFGKEEDELVKEILQPKKKKRKTSSLAEKDEKDLTENENNLPRKETSKDTSLILDSKLKTKKKKGKKDKTDVDIPFENNDLPEDSSENFLPIGHVPVQNKSNKPALPKWMSNPSVFGVDLKEQEIPISELPYLDENSKNNLKASKIDFLFPVQLAIIPWLVESMENNLRCLYRPSDLCVSAPTGSGKTLAFVLPIIQALKNRVVCAIRAIVVLPVSELAFQVYKVFKTYIQGTNLKVCILTGQKSFDAEQKVLVGSDIGGTFSKVDIVVTTPGRILDHIQRTNGFSLEQLQYLVIDEADRMMQDIQLGWLKKVEEAVYKNSNLPSCVCSVVGGKRMSYVPVTVCQTMHINEPLQKLLFSATLFHDPEKLHALSLYKPKLFTAQVNSDDSVGKCVIPEDLKVFSVVCSDGTKPMALCHFIKEKQFKRVLCFTESVERAQRLHLILAGMGILQVREISSNNRPVQRKIILGQFAAGKVDVIVCSDLVARGMDIEGVDCVVSYDIPPFVQAFVHRIGRTARAGKSGTAVALLTKNEIPPFMKMTKAAGISLTKEISVEDEELKPYLSSFQSALSVADTKVRKIKSEKAGKVFRKNRGKKKFSGTNSIPLKRNTKKVE